MLLEYESLLNVFLLLGMLYAFLFLYVLLTFSSNTYLKTKLLLIEHLPSAMLTLPHKSSYQKMMNMCHSQNGYGGVSLLTLCPDWASFQSGSLGYVTQGL